MQERKMIGLGEAEAAVKAMIEEASKGGRPMAVAVVDTNGDLVSFAKMNGATALNTRMAINKAYTSACFGMDTRMFFSWLKGDDKDISWYDDHRLTAVFGGVVIRTKTGIPVGAVGASGRKQEEDEALTLIGKKAAEALL
jgi:glc operon protein GlcG